MAIIDQCAVVWKGKGDTGKDKYLAYMDTVCSGERESLLKSNVIRGKSNVKIIDWKAYRGCFHIDYLIFFSVYAFFCKCVTSLGGCSLYLCLYK